MYQIRVGLKDDLDNATTAAPGDGDLAYPDLEFDTDHNAPYLLEKDEIEAKVRSVSRSVVRLWVAVFQRGLVGAERGDDGRAFGG